MLAVRVVCGSLAESKECLLRGELTFSRGAEESGDEDVQWKSHQTVNPCAVLLRDELTFQQTYAWEVEA